jgi:hypothetical protein
MNERVIEAAAAAVWNRYDFLEKRRGITFAQRDEHTRSNYRRDAEVAIRAADAARAEDVKAALWALENKISASTCDACDPASLTNLEDLDEADAEINRLRRALLALLGIEDTP